MEPVDTHVTTDDGVRLFAQTFGAGSPTVVIPNGILLLKDFGPIAKDWTVIAYDPRNRGRSATITDPSQLSRGILNDVDDLDAVRRHFGLEAFSLFGHSYIGLMVILYARAFPAGLERVVQIGPVGPFHGKAYPPHLTGDDEVLRHTLAAVAALQKEPDSGDPEERCRRFWSVLRTIFVTDPANAHRIDWGRCDLPNERNFMPYWMKHIMPSIHALGLKAGDFAAVRTPVVTIHGTRDRSAPYGGSLDWMALLPNARLVTIENGGHAPWIEAPDTVFGAIKAFLGGPVD